MTDAKDLTGKEFNRITVLKRTNDHIFPSGAKAVMWECVCKCGTKLKVLSQSLISGHTKSCGCLKKENKGENSHSYKHGAGQSSEYRIWSQMKKRCDDPKNKKYHDYGGRGISVQESWINDFNAFYKYMGKRPEGCSLDRIDNDGNYEEGNVRWATTKEQRLNQRRVSTSRNRFKHVHFHKLTGKYQGIFRHNDENFSVGIMESETECAIKLYKLYFDVKGHWPPYIDEDLKFLGLID